MKFRVVAMSDKAVCIGAISSTDYCVFRLQDTNEINLGHVISGDYTDVSSFDATNLTKNSKPWIQIEATGCTLVSAIELLLKLEHPHAIQAGSKSFSANSVGAIDEIREAILGR